MSLYNIWDDFYQLTHLSIDFPNSVNNKAAIYGNGKNQVEVMVTLRIVDKNLSPILLKEHDVKEHIFLCDFFSGSDLKSGWKISDKDNGYNKVIEYIQGTDAHNEKIEVMDDGFIGIRKFVSCDRQDNGVVIAGGVDIPGVGKFNTSQFGTSTKNGPNGKEGNEFKNPKNITIIAREPVRYSDKKNITIESGASSKIADLNYQKFYSNNTPSSYKGEITSSIIKILPSKETGVNNFFKEYVITTYKPIKNRNVSQKMHNIYSKDVFKCFSIFNEPHYPCAVIGKYQGNSHQVNLWYSMNDVIEVGGFYILNDSDGNYPAKYLCNPKVRTEYIDDKNGAVNLILHKNTITSSDSKPLYQYGWENLVNNPVINVIDSYGNEGNIELTFDNKEYFDIPDIV